MTKKRNFLGSQDKSAIILANVFPDSDIVISTPFQFDGERSGVYIEGKPDHLEVLFLLLADMIRVYNEEKYFGRWIAVTPPDEVANRTIVHYEATSGDLDKIQLLNIVLRKHLAEICDLRLSLISRLIVKVEEDEVLNNLIVLPKNFYNGSLLLSEIKNRQK